MKIILVLLIAFIIPLEGLTNNNNTNFIGFVDEVIEKENSSDRNNVYLRLLSSEDSSIYFADDYFLIYSIEETYHIILSDFIGKKIDTDIKIKLEEITVEKKIIKDVEVNYIITMGKIFPKISQTDLVFLYKELNPGIPGKDFYHRFIDAPVSYKNPEMGKFKLYYEICSDFDESLPTILIPTDGQRDLSQVGWADKYKNIFNLEYNTVTFEYRGMYASGIPLTDNKNVGWETMLEILNSDNVVEDIELIRKDLLCDKKFYILGGSGTAMIGLKYIAKYPENVERAFLMSFFKDAKGSSESGVQFFNTFLEENELINEYHNIEKNSEIDRKQLQFLIQRLLYFDQEEVKKMIIELDENKFGLYNEYYDQLGDVSYFVRSTQKYRPWAVVFMYETNINTSLNGLPDINYPFLEVAEPIISEMDKHRIENLHLFDIKGLENVNTKILLVAGTLDQVSPLTEMIRIHNELCNSELAVFEAYHCLQSSTESKKCRNNLANLFFKTGNKSKEILEYLESSGADCKFIKFY